MKRRVLFAFVWVFLLTSASMFFEMSFNAREARADSWGQVASEGMEGGYHALQDTADAMEVFNEDLYLSTSGPSGCEIWRYDRESWSQVNVDGFGDPSNLSAPGMSVYGGHLYVGTENGETGCEVWRYDGSGWRQINRDGFESAENLGAASMTSGSVDSRDRLYVGTSNETGCEVWQYSNLGWEQVGGAGLTDLDNRTAASLFVEGNALYVGTSNSNGCQVLSYDGAAWTQVNNDGFGDALNVGASSLSLFSGDLYSGTRQPAGGTGCEVWRYDGPTPADWVQVNANGFGDADNDSISLEVYDGCLYAGTPSDTPSGHRCEVWRYDGATWEKKNVDGFGDSRNLALRPMKVFEERLLVGTVNSRGCQVWEYDTVSWRKLNDSGFSGNACLAASSLVEHSGSTVAGTADNRFGCGVWGSEGGRWYRMNTRGFGDTGNTGAPSMQVFDDELYVGTENDQSGCEVWSYDGNRWEQVNRDGFGYLRISCAQSMAVSGAYFLVGTTCGQADGMIWVYDGFEWGRSFDGTGDPDILGIPAMAVYDSRVYAGTSSAEPSMGGSGCEIWRYDPGGWNRVNLNGFGDVENQGAVSMCEYQGRLFVGTRNEEHGCEVWNYDGKAWHKMADGGFGEGSNFEASAMVAHDARLYVGTENSTGAQVWSYDGSEWARESVPGFGNDYNLEVTAMMTRGSDILASTRNPLDGCEIWKAQGSAVRPGYQYTWYLAEGSTGSDENGYFETWVLLENPGADYANANVTYMTVAGPVEGPQVSLPPKSRYTIDVSQTLPETWSVSTLVTSDRPIAAERAMYWSTFQVFRQSAHESIGTAVPSQTWYFAEGSTGSNDDGSFETRILIQNPSSDDAAVELTYMTASGSVEGPRVELEGGTRKTVNVAATVPDEMDVATVVRSDVPVVAERAMYWTTEEVYRQSAHGTIGVTHPSREWYLAEGSTGWGDKGGFDTWVLVQNPGDLVANVEVDYMTPSGIIGGPELQIGPGTRRSVYVKDTLEDEFSVSAWIRSDQPVVAERSMYWTSTAVYRQAAHNSIGVTMPADEWLLAEGSTGEDFYGGFETWILVQNPNDTKTRIYTRYMRPDGSVVGPTYELGPRTRITFAVSDVSPGSWSVATRVRSELPVIAERAMYWTSSDGFYRQAAHDSIGYEP